MATETTPDQLSAGTRLFLRLPVVGWIAKDLLFGDKNNIWYLLVALISAWASSTIIFGIPGLYIPAVFSVPVIFFLLYLITRE
ncbi:hypothetical protein [Cochlodiniinecator piscidefendens]|uniref:hypothetical protein n=1 Tax=Cochlodiniinecator piscidefendens TaxID=2715756 RepID=UPI001409A8E6|nr:hypothetical protein [Cochlodiniinecator piscidefendens]